MSSSTPAEPAALLSLNELADMSLPELQEFLRMVKSMSEGGVLGTMDSITTTIMTSID